MLMGTPGRADRKGTPPSRREIYQWALQKLERTIDRLAECPRDMALVMAVIRFKKELVDARANLPPKKKENS